VEVRAPVAAPAGEPESVPVAGAPAVLV
jgi:hypothetical protein